MLMIITVYLASLIRNRTHRRSSSETCVGFLLRSLEMKRDGFLAFRRMVLLIIPAILASWWGGGTAPESPCDGPGSIFAVLSVSDQHLADDRDLFSAATRLVRV
jgi:hypothetical protein